MAAEPQEAGHDVQHAEGAGPGFDEAGALGPDEIPVDERREIDSTGSLVKKTCTV
ncbi:hypothetical protein WMF20_24530 [Sorangium sp. So ce834]|uniref:hypothetical protein n=1 Tax=Sorangium sp. So ce834 TaxID=3133321 RepID=UPI003F5E633D